METSERPSKQVHVRDSLYQHLNIYALAASAAAVSMLAPARTSEAEIIYTPANLGMGGGQSGTYILDLNGDGTTDFTFMASWINSASQAWGELAVAPSHAGNAVAEAANAGPAALQFGARIGPQTKRWGSYPDAFPLVGGHWSSEPFRWRCYGPWKNEENRYLGLKFLIGGEVQYGWAQLNTSCDEGIYEAVLTSYAYETIPNQSLKAGQEEDQTGPYGVVHPTALNFGQIAVGQTSSPQLVSLKNTGDSQLTISNFSISEDFAISTNDCEKGVKPGTHCNVYVTFTPPGVGAYTGTLTFTDNASNSPQTISLSGTGVSAAEKEGEIEGENLTGPGKETPPADAPALATLGMLAKGAAALSIWRRE